MQIKNRPFWALLLYHTCSLLIIICLAYLSLTENIILWITKDIKKCYFCNLSLLLIVYIFQSITNKKHISCFIWMLSPILVVRSKFEKCKRKLSKRINMKFQILFPQWMLRKYIETLKWNVCAQPFLRKWQNKHLSPCPPL